MIEASINGFLLQELAFHEEEKSRNKQVNCYFVFCQSAKCPLSFKKVIFSVLSIAVEFSIVK